MTTSESLPQPLPPLGSMEELRRRLAFTRPTDTSRGVFFTSVLEVVRRLGGDALAEGCLEACGERRFVEPRGRSMRSSRVSRGARCR